MPNAWGHSKLGGHYFSCDSCSILLTNLDQRMSRQTHCPICTMTLHNHLCQTLSGPQVTFFCCKRISSHRLNKPMWVFPVLPESHWYLKKDCFGKKIEYSYQRGCECLFWNFFMISLWQATSDSTRHLIQHSAHLGGPIWARTVKSMWTHAPFVLRVRPLEAEPGFYSNHCKSQIEHGGWYLWTSCLIWRMHSHFRGRGPTVQNG